MLHGVPATPATDHHPQLPLPLLEQMAAVDTGSGKIAFEEPTNMCVKEPFKRAVGIALPVGQCVMLDIHCGPFNRRGLNSHSTKDE